MALDLSTANGSSVGNGGVVDDREFGQRMRIIADRNPYMAENPDYLATMARSPYDTETLVSIAGQSYAMQAGDNLSKQLRGMSPATQRAIVSRLTPGQQASLNQLGYQPPGRDDGGGWFETTVDMVAKPLSVISKGASVIPGVSEVAGATLDTLTWIGNWPGHLYRTIETMDSNAQMMGLLGAGLGIAAVLAAPVTGGASLGTLSALGLLGGGGLLGATAAAAVTNPHDWMRAFNSSWNGERTFRIEAQDKVNVLLTDPRAAGIATDLSAMGINAVDLAKELAGHREQDPNSQMNAIYKMASTMASPNTQQYQQAVSAMLNAMKDPVFQEAVQTLNAAKISPGRDLAGILGLDPGSTLYNVVSGATDATFTVAVDPTLMLGYANKLLNAKRFTFALFEGAEASTAFRKFVHERPAIMRTYVALADAVEHSSAGGVQKLRGSVPQLEPLYNDVVQYRQGLIQQGLLDGRSFNADDVIEYLSGHTNFKPLLEGKGSMKNANGLQLYAQSAPRAAWRDFRNEVRSFVTGMADISTEAKMAKLAKQHGVSLQEEMLQQVHHLAAAYGRDFQEFLPTQLSDMIGEGGLIDKPWRFVTGEQGHLYSTGRAFSHYARTVPVLGRAVGRVGEALTAMTTMSVAGKAISLTGPNATKEIRALTELGRYMGLPSYFRHAWADVMLSADSPAGRLSAAHGWLANMMRMTGIDKTEEGRRIIDEYLVKSRQLYGADDLINVNGHKMHAGIFLNEQADKLVMPNLHELRHAAVTGPLSAIMGISDMPFIEQMMNKIWKPAVLLRLGFIPRAAGEELASFMLRGGLGSFTQEFGARYLGNIEAYEEATRKVATAKSFGMEAVLTKAEQKLLARGVYSTLPAHVRPLVRMAARQGWEDPMMRHMLVYRDWLAKGLTKGLGHSAAVYDVPEEAMKLIRAGQIPIHRPGRVSMNYDRFKGSILLGKEYSVRRMIAGGVNDDLVEAGREWASGHATQVMRSLSAVNSGPIDPGFDNSKIHTVLEMDPKTREMRPVVMMTERGMRQTVGHGDPFFETSTLESVQRPLAEPAFRDAWLEHGTRITGGVDINERDLGTAADALFEMGRVKTDLPGQMGTARSGNHARQIMRELIATDFSREHWAAMLVDLRRDGGDTVATALEAYIKDMVDPTISDISTALLNARVDLRPAQFAHHKDYINARRALDDVRVDLETHGTVVENWLGSMPLAEREFAAQFLDGQIQMGDSSVWSRHKAALAQPAAAPTGLTPDQLATIDRLRNAARNNPGAFEDPSGDFYETEWARATHWSNIGNEPDSVVAAVPPKLLYRDLDEARPYLVDAARANILNPNYHEFGVPKSMRGAEFDDTGQYIDTELKDATVMLYQVPNLKGRRWEQVIANAGNREIVMANEKIIRQLLGDAADTAEAALVADVRLAEELAKIDAKMAGIAPEMANMPRVLRQDRRITDGRIHGQLRPDVPTKSEGKTSLWYYPRSAVEVHSVPLADMRFDPAKEWAEQIVSRFSDVSRRGTKQVRRAKQRVGMPDPVTGEPTTTPIVHRWRNEQLQPIGPDEEIALGETKQLADYKGDPIHYGDLTKLSGPLNEEATQGAQVMWELVGPATRDAWAERAGGVRVRRKKVTSEFSMPGKPVQSMDFVTVPRAQISDVRRTPQDDLPQHAISEVYTNRRVGKWDQFVRFGFDQVIGPSIDAIVRRPMSFHHFANRYVLAKRSLDWTLDPVLLAKVGEISKGYGLNAHTTKLNPESLGNFGRVIAQYHGDANAATWTTDHTLAWLRGHTDAELSDLLTRTISAAAHDQTTLGIKAHGMAKRFAKEDVAGIRAAIAGATDPVNMLDAVVAALPINPLADVSAVRTVEGGVSSGPVPRDSLSILARGGKRSEELTEAIKADPLLTYLDNNDAWKTLDAMRTNLTYQRKAASEIAATAAVADAMPFIDSHEFKTQFADYAQGFLPFWYAEENFMKRWARGLADEGPAMIRKAQLGYMGMKQAGVIRTDESGRDWFVYPGSGLLVDVMSRIPGLSALQGMGIMFQTPTDSMLPGLNNRFGIPSFNPLVTMPMGMVTAIFPELEPIERAVLGDFVSGRGVIDQIVPAHVRNLYGALFGDASTNTRYASAMSTAIAWAEAHDKGPGDDATPGEVQEFLDMVRKHARIIVLAQALGGFIVPGAPSEVAAGRSANIAGINIGNPADYLSSQYVGLVRELGVEAGTQKYLELNPDADLLDIVDPDPLRDTIENLDGVTSPLAYTVPRNVSTSGAPIPATEEAFQFMEDNADYFREFPNAAPWLFPQNYAADGERSSYAYDQQVADGMRRRRSPEELLDATMFKLGAQEYFLKRDLFQKAIADATLANDKATADQVRAQMDWELAVFRVAHPRFTEQLESSDGRVRRQRIMDEMRNIVDDPLRPSESSPQLESIRVAVKAFDTYSTRLTVLKNDHTNQGRREVDHLKQQFSAFMDQFIGLHPEVSSFWISVLKPEASL